MKRDLDVLICKNDSRLERPDENFNELTVI